MPHGLHDAITDVPGVRVGHRTLVRGTDIRTGVTTIVPDPLPTPAKPLRCNAFVGNGHGKAVGLSQVQELGELETPIVLTNTLSTFLAADALLDWMLQRTDATSLNPVVAECNDGWLSDIRARAVSAADVRAALDGATDGPVERGSVGAGTGMRALGFKAGIGTASRLVGAHTVGVLVLANFTGRLRLGGREVAPADEVVPEGNSCIVVVATDLPVDARQLRRLAARGVYAMARVGAEFRHGSGDYAIAFTTSHETPMDDRALDDTFVAVLDATEAALLDALWSVPTTRGVEGHVAHGLRETLADRGEAR
ncbi:S58 family peptidase [Calidifontibacter sp. DB0510]|uniref:S58 family peptidase n=1 Tax=Metallococcus carri TaxID=1656884 RepID=A0A967AWZ9_9MICO|nr:P1 family peptidase [Metallococcus carri]NHN54516.1 S58 family peptidase [Metallococcus carri]NOP36645.1 S58 family peptidase [Calidifontibacter sp. DB2511S]